MYHTSQTPHLMVSPNCLSLHGALILEMGASDSGHMALHEISKTALGVSYFMGAEAPPVFYTSKVISERHTKGKLNRVLLTFWLFRVYSL